MYIREEEYKMNYEIENKEYIIQYTKRGWRAISWHPHYIATDFAKSKDQAILDGNDAIEKYYKKVSIWSDNSNFNIKPEQVFKL